MSANTFLPPSPVIPQFLVISSITRSRNAIVTVITPNSFVPGQFLYFSVPKAYGMTEINALTGKILLVSGGNLIFATDIDSTQFSPFVTPSFGQEQPATVSPAGSQNLYNFTTVPFRSLDGSTGN